MPCDITSQKSSSSASSEASETCQSVSECSSPTTDWSKPGPYEQPLVSTLQRRKEPLERLREPEASAGAQGYSGMHPEDPQQRPRMTPASIAAKVTAKHGEEVSPAASDLAMVLTRGLSMEQQKSSRDSLQYSSGYSTQTTTPSCSEDTIPSQVSDYDCYSVNGDAEGEVQADFDRSSTIPRHSNIAQNYRRMIQTKRPASTAGLPSGMGAQGGPAGRGAAHPVQRGPHPHPPAHRAGEDAHRARLARLRGPPGRVGSEECVFYAEDASPNALEYVKASPKRLSLPNTAWGAAAGLGEMSVYGQPAAAATAEEEQLLAANRHSLVEKIGELVASATPGRGPVPLPLAARRPAARPQPRPRPRPPRPQGEDMLVSIRRGVRLRKTISNDRSAPRIL
ncbi:hypothetical protein ANANG_G00109540 [Anguilla anguilla]|uniref:WH2 domain-containing protein n=1 Tax=Anguilla anguilla TaxID=7936 RepID=A0A9D3MKJ6_ANGAN|nr:hypothetical protein ANANG_G00109540 [Anguilla anguilla]